jgi:hypothetical protein
MKLLLLRALVGDVLVVSVAGVYLLLFFRDSLATIGVRVQPKAIDVAEAEDEEAVVGDDDVEVGREDDNAIPPSPIRRFEQAEESLRVLSKRAERLR